MRFVFPFLILLLIGVSSCESNNGAVDPPTAMKKVEINLDSAQVVLTNRYGFHDGGYAIGGASFLLQGKKGPLLCTAKHLLGEPMGISPEIKTSEFEKQLRFWEAFADEGNVFDDVLKVNGLVNKKASQVDILLLKVEKSHDDMQVLKPRYSKVKLGENMTVIASERGDGVQKKFPVIMDEYNRTSYIVRAKKEFNPHGMSGSPVVDANGYAVGVLVGGGHFEGKLYLTVEPLNLVKKYLR